MYSVIISVLYWTNLTDQEKQKRELTESLARRENGMTSRRTKVRRNDDRVTKARRSRRPAMTPPVNQKIQMLRRLKSKASKALLRSYTLAKR